MLNGRGVWLTELWICPKNAFLPKHLTLLGTIGHYSIEWYAHISCGRVVSLVVANDLKLGMTDNLLSSTVNENVQRLLLKSAHWTLRRLWISCLWKHAEISNQVHEGFEGPYQILIYKASPWFLCKYLVLRTYWLPLVWLWDDEVGLLLGSIKHFTKSRISWPKTCFRGSQLF